MSKLKINQQQHLNQPNNDVYFRSKMLNVRNSSNELVSAASPIISLISRMSQMKIADNSTYAEFLLHEAKAFASHTQKVKYSPETIIATQNILEYWLAHVTKNTIKTPFCQDTNALLDTKKSNPNELKQQISLIIETALCTPQMHLDLLELIYIAHRLGMPIPQDCTEINHNLPLLSDQMYYQIRKYRQSLKPQCSNDNNTPTQKILPTPAKINLTKISYTIVGFILSAYVIAWALGRMLI